MPRIINKKNGFTLVETVVVISIITILSTVILIDYRRGQRQYVLDSAVNELISDFRWAQNAGLSFLESSSGITPRSWGIFLSLSNTDRYRYIIYGDAKDLRCSFCYEAGTSDILYKTVSLPQGVSISSFDVIIDYNPSFTLTNGMVNIIFSPPDPSTGIRVDTDYDYSGSSCVGGTLNDFCYNISSVEISLSYGAQTKKVTVTKDGVIQ